MSIYVNSFTEPAEEAESKRQFLPLLSRRALQEGFWNDELHSEIMEQHMEYRFKKPEDREACMVEIERARTQSMYSHDCYKGCKDRGNAKLYRPHINLLYSYACVHKYICALRGSFDSLVLHLTINSFSCLQLC